MKKKTRQLMEEFLKKYASNELTLDIGSGDSPYRKYFPNMKTADIKGDVDYICDVHELPFEDESFDVVLATEMLEHCENPSLAISEMARVLKKFGRIILTTRFVFPYHDPPDYYRFTPSAIEKLAKDNSLKVVRIESEEAFSEIFHRLQHTATGFRRSILLTIMFMLRRYDDELPPTGVYAVLRK